MFYGLGGIGKSRLSRELESRLHRERPESVERLSFRHDFDSGQASDIESILLGLRAVLGNYRPVWPAFDLAFAAYWERAHPGIPMQTVLNNSSMLRRLSGSSQVGTQIQDAVQDLLASPGGVLGIFVAGAKALGGSVRDRIAERQLLRECPFFEPVVSESDPIVMRSYLASLLAWDLARVQERRAADGVTLSLTVFFDTWERVQESEPRRNDLEDLLARIAYLTPNALFVLTGRNQVRWADEASRACMQWAGPERWPFLADELGEVEPRQHLVGSLSNTDAERFLTLRLQDSGEPAIPVTIRQRIIAGASGVPLYLDLSAVQYAQGLARGAEVSENDFGQPFPEVVLRILRDLKANQRTLLRMASMVSRFDADLLLAGASDLPDSALEQFLRRSLVQRYPNDFLPYGIHESLRDAVQDADVAEDRWSEREWSAAAARLLAEIHRRIRPELDATGAIESSTLAGYFVEAFRLTSCTKKIPSWVWQLAGRLHSIGNLAALAGVMSVVPEGNVAIHNSAYGLWAIAHRRTLGPERTAEILDGILRRSDLDPVGRQYLGYWSAWMLDESGRWDAARALRLSLSSSDGYFRPFVAHALSRSDWVCGRLRDAVAAIFDDADPLQRFWQQGIAGRVAWICGRFEEADSLFEERIETARSINALDLYAHALRTRAELRCFTRPGSQAEAAEAIDIYRRIGVPVSEAECRVAVAIANTTPTSRDEVREALAPLRQPTAGVPVYALVAEIFADCVAGRLEPAVEAFRQLQAAREGDSYVYWEEIASWWIAELDATVSLNASTGTDWVYGKDEARQSWTQVLRARREPDASEREVSAN
ncbi:hypothetical protein [Cryptosporangium aurantiacum]|uniref:hypothetical protein n=1 Tax=Cryptosporangium aurantiacum TaxID=134849 RepID=UPI0011613068|nr:hypothetical protein [Cryptosporangium aurantiacum]